MLSNFHMEKDWKIISVLRCTSRHAVLSVQNRRTGVPKIIKIIHKKDFDSATHRIVSHLSDSIFVLPDRVQTCGNWKILFFPLLTPLKEYVHKEGLSLSEILTLTENVTDAINEMHHNKLLHLDISPDNIFVSADGNFLLGDFSNARSLKKKHPLLRTTPDYTPPECTQGIPLPASDQYSFAVLLFALLHKGSVPNMGQTDFGCDSLLFEKERLKLSAEGIEYPAALYTCFQKAMSPKPYQRYADISSFAEDFITCLQPIARESTYRMLLADTGDAFFQIHTIPLRCKSKSYSLPKNLPRKSLGAAAAILFCTLMAIVFVLSPSPGRHSKTAASYHTTPSPTSLEMEQVLDISNKQADTLAELLNDESVFSVCKILYGENNHFSSLEELQEFSQMEQLYLSGNQLTSLQDLSGLDTLETLILSDNKITDIMPLTSLSGLTVLDVSGNPDLCQIDSLKNLKNLQLLIVTDTSVSSSSLRSLQCALPDCEIISN